MPNKQVTITVAMTQDPNSNYWIPSSVSVSPDPVTIKLSQGTWTITFDMEAASGSPPSAQLWFARNQAGWGSLNPVVFKPLTEDDVDFPAGWSEAQKEAFLITAQNALNGVTSVPSNSNRSLATVTFDPTALEPGQQLDIRLPYTLDYFINVQGVSYGPNTFDPEVDIDPT